MLALRPCSRALPSLAFAWSLAAAAPPPPRRLPPLASLGGRGIGGMGHINAFTSGEAPRAPRRAWQPLDGGGSSERHTLCVMGRDVTVTSTNSPAEMDAWIERHVLRPLAGTPTSPAASAAASAAAAPPSLMMPLGVDCEFQPRFTRGAAAPPLAIVQLATADAVLVAQIVGLQPAAGAARGAAATPASPPLPRALTHLFASAALRTRILPVGVGVREDVVKLLDTLGLRNSGAAGAASASASPLPPQPPPLAGGRRHSVPLAAPAPPPAAPTMMMTAVRELSAPELLACLLAGASSDDAALPPPSLLRLSLPPPASSPAAVACVNLSELNAWLGLGRGAGHSTGLESLARQLLGFPRWKRKSITLSAWEAWPLERAQTLYAAMDALASLHVFLFQLDALARTRGARPVPRPRRFVPSDDVHAALFAGAAAQAAAAASAAASAAAHYAHAHAAGAAAAAAASATGAWPLQQLTRGGGVW